MRGLTVGDCVVYRVYKISTHPTPRAKELYPSLSGETYSYAVDKYWIVADVHADQRIEVVTRSGKLRSLNSNDPNLHKASLFEEVRLRERFPQLAEVIGWRRRLWLPCHEDIAREVILLYLLMFILLVALIVWHPIRLQFH